MTPKESEPTKGWKSTRIKESPPDLFDPDQPRLGRRESEPHSAEVTYLHDVLKTNFPEGRVFWDLHHYFIAPKGALEGKKIALQFDISFFRKCKLSYALSSYDARNHEGRVPDIAINVLSKSTWQTDISEHVEACQDLSIPVYVVFSPYLATSKRYAPPFLRAYILQANGEYKEEELRELTVQEEQEINQEKIIDISAKLPFRLGLIQLKQKYIDGKHLYRLVLLDPSKPKILPTRREKELLEAKKKIENTKQEAEDAKQEAEDAKQEANALKKRIKAYRDKFGELAND
jgi:Uma2 family endonuclease